MGLFGAVEKDIVIGIQSRLDAAPGYNSAASGANQLEGLNEFGRGYVEFGAAQDFLVLGEDGLRIEDLNTSVERQIKNVTLQPIRAEMG